MQHNYDSFPSFINVDEMQINLHTDQNLWSIRQRITEQFCKIFNNWQSYYSTKCIIVNLPRGLNYRQISALYYELNDRGFTLIYNVQEQMGNLFTCGEAKTNYHDIDPYGNMPLAMKISW